MSTLSEHGGRSYHQWCGMAKGLDIIGERWTMLILRDLLLGPKRYKDLLDGLPGIGTNLLAARLRMLEEHDVIRRRVLPPPAGSAVYELTERGEMLRPVLFGIGGFGAQYLSEPEGSESFPITAHMLASRGHFRPEEAAGVSLTYEVVVNGQPFTIHVQDGECEMESGAARSPDVRMEMDAATYNALFRGSLSVREAAESQVLSIEGSIDDAERYFRMFSLAPLLRSNAERAGAEAGI